MDRTWCWPRGHRSQNGRLQVLSHSLFRYCLTLRSGIVSLFVQVLSHSLFLLPVTCLTLNNHISLPPAAIGTLHYMHGVSPCPIPIPLFSTSQYMQKTSLLQVQGLQGACFHCQRFGCDARWPQVSQGGALFMDGCCMRHAEPSHLL